MTKLKMQKRRKEERKFHTEENKKKTYIRHQNQIHIQYTYVKVNRKAYMLLKRPHFKVK